MFKYTMAMFINRTTKDHMLSTVHCVQIAFLSLCPSFDTSSLQPLLLTKKQMFNPNIFPIRITLVPPYSHFITFVCSHTCIKKGQIYAYNIHLMMFVCLCTFVHVHIHQHVWNTHLQPQTSIYIYLQTQHFSVDIKHTIK